MPTVVPQLAPRFLIIDNYDSYTFNLFQFFSAYLNVAPVVIRNNQFSWKEFKSTILPHFDAIVISPGPGRPDVTQDFGICSDILLNVDLPIFGVCLGHQGLAAVLNGKVVRADPPMHGRLSDIFHDGKGLFKSIPSPFKAVRYHSLVVANDLPNDLEMSAWTNDGSNQTEPIIMGLTHKSKNIWSVQFHPESISTEYGQTIINNFCALAYQVWTEKGFHESDDPLPSSLDHLSVIPEPLVSPELSKKHNFKAIIEPLSHYVESETVFSELFSSDPHSFWLDSAKVEDGISRYSFMGDCKGPEGYFLNYSLKTRIITERRSTGEKSVFVPSDETFFTYLAQIMHDAKIEKDAVEYVNSNSIEYNIPFMGGLVGFIGYEMKSETLKYEQNQAEFLTKSADDIPDSCFLFTDRLVVFDHLECRILVVTLVDQTGSHGSIRKIQQQWMNDTKSKIERMVFDIEKIAAVQTDVPILKIPQIQLAHQRDEYIQMIDESLSKIDQGETYEVCLTTQLKGCLSHPHPSPYQLYKHLRKRNPAPYAAYLSFGNDLTITSSSPERFLRIIDDGVISMKPIKGTLKRATPLNFKGTASDIDFENERRRHLLATSEKDRSENLMIVDLIRNDLNQISKLNSVTVPALMVVESYATVHQLVSTVQATLRDELTAVDAVMRSFPPGSMTGAPKLRTCQIIEQLEKIPRGPYSGVIGFFSVTGQSDFSVVIRTAIFNQRDDVTHVSIGAGGAIVALSDPKDEFEEMVLKAQSVLPSLNHVYRNHFL
ncbi:ADC synthase [Globomyces pollinis-pini]|nr:ADC synthase [Globomyces pollinis-pini]